MGWIQFIILMIMFSTLIKLLYNESINSKIARELATLDRKEMLQSIKNIDTEVKDLNKALNPIEKRHFR